MASKQQLITRFRVNAPGYAQKHTVYWLNTGELVLADHQDQTFAQFIATWDLMGRPDDTSCRCAQFVGQFRRTVSADGGRYSSSFRELENSARGDASNYLSLGLRTDTVVNVRGYRNACSGVSMDQLAKDRRKSLTERAWGRKRDRFQKTMSQVLHDLAERAGYQHPVLSISWGDDHNPLGPIFTEPRVHGVKARHPQLEIKANAYAWDTMRRGWNRVADPDHNPLVGGKLVINPETQLPALCFKVIAVTDKPGVQRFRVGYRRMSLRYTDTGAVVESWHPFHDLRPIADIANDRY